jgi:hypothetical protein
MKKYSTISRRKGSKHLIGIDSALFAAQRKKRNFIRNTRQ